MPLGSCSCKHTPSSSWESYSPLLLLCVVLQGQSQHWSTYTAAQIQPRLQQVSSEGEVAVMTHAVQKENPHDRMDQSKAQNLLIPLPPVSTQGTQEHKSQTCHTRHRALLLTTEEEVSDRQSFPADTKLLMSQLSLSSLLVSASIFTTAHGHHTLESFN